MRGTVALVSKNNHGNVMVDTATHATDATGDEAREPVAYELAFHFLPTVAEGEVETEFQSLKATLADAGATLFDEEMPERIELAYEIEKRIDGKLRRFDSAYFGWVRFEAAPAHIAAVTAAVKNTPAILRYLLVTLTPAARQNPFRFHEARAAARVTDVDAEAADVAAAAQEPDAAAGDTPTPADTAENDAVATTAGTDTTQDDTARRGE